MSTLSRIIAVFSIWTTSCLTIATHAENNDDIPSFQLEGIEVFSNKMKIIDGFTGKEYVGDHPAVLGFRREFDFILKRYHQKLLVDEAEKLKQRGETIKPFGNDLSELASRFGIKDFELEGPHLTREISIFKRMVKDPFFNIEELVVWNLSRLKASDGTLPDNKYSNNIRFNEESGSWERRVTTKWEVSWVTRDRHRRQIYKYKEQGLNLDTHKGYHIVHGGIRPDVPSEAFQVVKLSYPIFYDVIEDTDTQVKNLSENFLRNLIYIYDPYSWAVRGNTRFRGGFSRQLRQHIKTQALPIQDRDWFDKVLANFINDVITIKFWGSDEIYDLQMLSIDKKNLNQLGVDLDLLNWNSNDKRTLDYDPEVPSRIPNLDFDSTIGARYVLLDAYRRFGDKFLDTLILRFNAIEKRTDSKRFLKDVIAEVSGVSADKYIPAAIKVQKAELKRFQRPTSLQDNLE